MKFKVLKKFRQAINIRKQVEHNKGDEIEVDDDKIESWSAAGFIDGLKDRIGDIDPVDGDDEDETDTDDDNSTDDAEDTGNSDDEADGSDEDTDVSDSTDAEGNDNSGSDENAVDYMAMEKDDLETFAKEKFSVDLDKRKGLPKLQAEVKALMEAE